MQTLNLLVLIMSVGMDIILPFAYEVYFGKVLCKACIFAYILYPTGYPDTTARQRTTNTTEINKQP